MPLDPVKVSLAVSSGLSVVCASCELYWEGVDRKLDKCLAKSGCGSPIAGDDFHEYRGPLTNFLSWCFVCAADADFVVKVKDKSRVFGICSKHFPLLHQLKPIGKESSPALVVTERGVFLADDLKPKPQKSLAKAIYEVESYFRTKNL